MITKLPKELEPYRATITDRVDNHTDWVFLKELAERSPKRYAWLIHARNNAALKVMLRKKK